jgi:hypothetical protein
MSSPTIRGARAAGGLAAVALACSLSLAAPPAEAGETATDNDAYASASGTYHVPENLLKAVAYAQTGGEAHKGEPSVAGGWGPMHLVDRSLLTGKGTPLPARGTTLATAAKLTGHTQAQLKNSAAANIDGGAALLAKAQRGLGRETGADTNAGDWYAAVASFSGSKDKATATQFADDVYDVLTDGSESTLGTKSIQDRRVPAARIDRTGLKKLHLRPAPKGRAECPIGLDCEWIPSPYQLLGDGKDQGNYGNHDVAQRPKRGNPSIDYIVIHSTEGTYDTSVDLAKDPEYLAWNYTLRSSDGHVAQHVANKDVGWHAGNWYTNQHSIGVEHEGFVAEGKWFTEPMYRSSAKLVRYLATKYGVPLDRNHIIGHDQVPGLATDYVKGMHNDPGPYWDWEHYFDLLHRPLTLGTTRAQIGDVVRILPGFQGNSQPLTGCGDNPCDTTATNFVTLHKAPSDDAELVDDPGLHPDGKPSGTGIEDHGARLSAGTDFVVADRTRDWTAVWYLGEKAWFKNPGQRLVTRSVVGAQWATPKAGTKSVKLYGSAYPEASAYSDPDDVQPQLTVDSYTFGAGQKYVVTDSHVATDYYKAQTFSEDTPNDHVDIRGKEKFVQISFGHRFYYVKAADVDLHRW